MTRIVVNTSEFAIHHVVMFFIVVIAFYFLWRFLLKSPQFKFTVDILKFKLPIVGKEIIYKAAVSRFCHTLGVLIAGGVGLSSAIEITAKVVDNLYLGKAIERIRVRVISGIALSDEIKAQKVFPHLVSKMVAVGEKTGRIDNMLVRTASYYDEELETSLQNLTALLEPALLIFIGGIVLIAVLALYLPIFKLSAAMK